MAQASVELIDALRQMARRMESGSQTGLSITEIAAGRRLQDLSLSPADLQQLQTLSDPEVLEHMQTQPQAEASFPVQYLRAWANLLEDQLLAMLDLPVDIRHLQLAA